MAQEEKKQIKNTIPVHLAQALKYAEMNHDSIKTSLVKMNLKDFDDAMALKNIEKVIELSKKIKIDRYERKSKKQSPINISRDYEVIEIDSTLTRKASKIIRNIRSLQDSNMNAIQSNFIRNQYDEVRSVLDTNQLLIDEVDNVLTILSKTLSNRIKTGKYDKDSVIIELINHFGVEKISSLLKLQVPEEEVQKKTA